MCWQPSVNRFNSYNTCNRESILLARWRMYAVSTELIFMIFSSYFLQVDIRRDNVCKVRCAAEFLQMTSPGNLADLTDRYLQVRPEILFMCNSYQIWYSQQTLLYLGKTRGSCGGIPIYYIDWQRQVRDTFVMKGYFQPWWKRNLEGIHLHMGYTCLAMIVDHKYLWRLVRTYILYLTQSVIINALKRNRESAPPTDMDTVTVPCEKIEPLFF